METNHKEQQLEKEEAYRKQLQEEHAHREQLHKSTIGKKKDKWYKSNIFIILLLILVNPVGVFFMWKFSSWKTPVKGIITVVFGLYYFHFIYSISPAFTNADRKITIARPTPVADQQWIDAAAKRYYDTHKDLFTNPISLDDSKNFMKMCINQFQDKSKCNDIINKKFWIGMSKEFAYMSLGKFDGDNKTVTANGTHEQWVYGNPLYGATYLYFQDEVLTSYQN